MASGNRYIQAMATITTGRQGVRRRHEELRAAGLRRVQIWIPDTRTDDFAEECARQARRIRASEIAAEEEAWHEACDTSGWTA